MGPFTGVQGFIFCDLKKTVKILHGWEQNFLWKVHIRFICFNVGLGALFGV